MQSDVDDVRGRGVSDDATGNDPTGSGNRTDAAAADVQAPPSPFPSGQQSSRVEQLEVVEGKGKREEEKEKQRGSFVNSLRSGVVRWVDGWMVFLREILLLIVDFNCGFRCRRMFSLESLKRKLPIVKWISTYTLSDLQGDVIAGLTVGLTVIPQSLAYANIAKLKPHFGLYSAFMGCFVYVVLGTSRDVTFGPTAVMSLLTAEFCSEGMNDGEASLAVVMTLICGVVQVVMGLLHIGFLVDYISHPVINSFTTAAAITIACSQVKKWLGLKDVPRDFIPQFYETIRKIPETKIFDFVLGLICMILLYTMKKMKDWKIGKNSNQTKCLAVSKYLVWLSSTARNAIIVALASGVAGILWTFQLTDVFSLTKEIRQGFPPFSLPNFTLTIGNETKTPMETIQTMGIGVVIVPLLGVIETIAIGKAFGRKHDYNIDANQELLAVGFSNVLGSFVQSYPVTASFSRSAVNAQSGVRTPGGGVFTGALVLLALAFLTPVFYFIPNAGLAAVIIMAVTDMIDFSMVKKLWKTKKSDLVPWFISFFVSLIYGFEYGIMLGVAASLLILLHSWSRPKIQVTREERDELLGCPQSDSSSDRCPVIKVTMDLMFPGIDHLQDVILKAAFSDSNPKSVSLNLSNVSDVDFTAVEGIKELQEIFSKRKSQLVITNAACHIAQRLAAGNVRDIQTTESMDSQRRNFVSDAIEGDEGLLVGRRRTDGGQMGLGSAAAAAAEGNNSADEDDETNDRRRRGGGGGQRTGSKSKLTRDGSVVIEIIPSTDDVIDQPHDASV